MKFRMLILAVAVMAFASMSFGQGGANISFIWAEGYNMDTWYPLTYCDSGDDMNTVLAEGTRCILYYDANAFDLPDPLGMDYPAVVGSDGAAGQILPTNEFFFETPATTAPPGFNATSFVMQGAVPAGFAYYYLVLCCDDGEGGCIPFMYSQRFSFSAGYNEIVLGNPTNDPFNPTSPPWTRIECCTPPEPFCEPTPSPVYLECVPYPEPRMMCAQLCVDYPLVLEMGPFAPNEYPLVSILPGCNHGQNGCDEDCTPGDFFFDPVSWIYNGVTGMWTCQVIPISNGCVCIEWIDCKTPVGLMSFTAEPTVNGIKLEFNTGAETDNSHFEILKSEAGNEYEILAQLETQGNGATGHTYTYLDEDVSIDHTYSYRLADVAINGNRTVHEEFTVTATAVGGNLIPEGYELYVYPNPFNPTTTISFNVTESMSVQLAVYDVTGRQVAELVNSAVESGQHDITFDATGLPSGIYLAKLSTEMNTSVQKMILMK